MGYGVPPMADSRQISIENCEFCQDPAVRGRNFRQSSDAADLGTDFAIGWITQVERGGVMQSGRASLKPTQGGGFNPEFHQLGLTGLASASEWHCRRNPRHGRKVTHARTLSQGW